MGEWAGLSRFQLLRAELLGNRVEMRLKSWLLGSVWRPRSCALIPAALLAASKIRDERSTQSTVCFYERYLHCYNHWLCSVCIWAFWSGSNSVIGLFRATNLTPSWIGGPAVKARALIAISSACLTVMRRNPFMVDGCCRKGSRNALQELYNPTQVLARGRLCSYSAGTIAIMHGTSLCSSVEA